METRENSMDKHHDVNLERDAETEAGEKSEEEDVNNQSSVQSAKKNSLSDSLLLMSLSQFYMQKGNIEKIIPVINCNSKVSLRLLDWFVTNFAKKKNIIITKPNEDGTSTVYFNVYLSYRAQLKAYSKQHFDPFRRRDRIDYYYEKDKYVQTTIGQLNFFKWVIQNDIIKYISDHALDIETDMMKNKNKTSARRGREANKNGPSTQSSPASSSSSHRHEDRYHTLQHGQCFKDASELESDRASKRVVFSSLSDQNGTDDLGTNKEGSSLQCENISLSSLSEQDDEGSWERGTVNHIQGMHVVRFD